MQDTSQMTLTIRAKGEIVSTNFPAFQQWVRAGLESVNMGLTTDDEFIEADGVVKNLTTIEDGIKAAKDAMLRDAKTLYDILTEMDGLCAETAKVRLALSKQIAKRKEEVRAELLSEAMESLDCAVRLRHYFSRSMAEAMKGKKNLDSIKRSLDVTVAIHNGMIRKSRAKIDAHVSQHGTALVMDRDELEIKTPEVVDHELRRRIEAHQAEQECKRLQEEAAAARAEASRIAAEQARAERARIESERKPDSQPARPEPTITTEHRSDGHDRVVVNFPARQNPPAPVVGAIPAGQSADQEWSVYWECVKSAFRTIKEATERLTHDRNLRAAGIFATGANEAGRLATKIARGEEAAK